MNLSITKMPIDIIELIFEKIGDGDCINGPDDAYNFIIALGKIYFGDNVIEIMARYRYKNMDF